MRKTALFFLFIQFLFMPAILNGAEEPTFKDVMEDTVWFEKNSPPERELADSAEKQTRQWREKNELCLPKFPDEQIDQLRNTLDYPPEGSAVKEIK